MLTNGASSPHIERLAKHSHFIPIPHGGLMCLYLWLHHLVCVWIVSLKDLETIELEFAGTDFSLSNMD